MTVYFPCKCSFNWAIRSTMFNGKYFLYAYNVKLSDVIYRLFGSLWVDNLNGKQKVAGLLQKVLENIKFSKFWMLRISSFLQFSSPPIYLSGELMKNFPNITVRTRAFKILLLYCFCIIEHLHLTTSICKNLPFHRSKFLTSPLRKFSNSSIFVLGIYPMMSHPYSMAAYR